MVGRGRNGNRGGTGHEKPRRESPTVEEEALTTSSHSTYCCCAFFSGSPLLRRGWQEGNRNAVASPLPCIDCRRFVKATPGWTQLCQTICPRYVAWVSKLLGPLTMVTHHHSPRAHPPHFPMHRF
uniref:Uncharacterized protein n=1 Tax=Physcomitrium patens TaxID=3218 RepID=A0A2K1IDT5_PHYPA|nr:hypothetical protein PHYPA_029582 [Physcomitrium patens]